MTAQDTDFSKQIDTLAKYCLQFFDPSHINYRKGSVDRLSVLTNVIEVAFNMGATSMEHECSKAVNEVFGNVTTKQV